MSVSERLAEIREDINSIELRLNDVRGSGGGGGAPANAQYVTMAVDATLTAERVLTAGAGLGLVDGGAGGAATVSLSHLGLEALANPGADRIFFWDNGAGAAAWLVPTEGVQINALNLLLDISGLAALNPADPAADYVVVYDANVGTHKKVLPNNLGIGGGDVSAAANLADNTAIRGDGGVKGVQDSTVYILDTGWVGINVNPPTAPLHLQHASQTPDMIIEETTAGSAAQLEFKNTGRSWWIQADQSPDLFSISQRTTPWNLVLLDPNGQMVVGSNVGTTLNSDMTAGLTLYQAGYDDEILAGKSSDVAHGCTNYAETNTFYCHRKVNAASGGLRTRAFNEQYYAWQAHGFYGASASPTQTAKSVSGRAIMEMNIYKISGVSVTNVDANTNLFGIRAQRGGSIETVGLLDEDGDGWIYGGLTCDTDYITLGMESDPTLRFSRDTTGTLGQVGFTDSGSNHQWVFGAKGTDYAASPDQFGFFEYHGSWRTPFILLQGLTNNTLVLGSSLRVAIGTATMITDADLYLAASGWLALKETSTPTATGSVGKLYTKNDNKLYFQDGAGTEHEIQYV